MSTDPPSAEDDAFARRLWDEKFVKQVRKASRPVFPEILRPDREDIIQEALAKAYEKREQFKGQTQEDLLGWVLVILRNLTIDILRKRSREPAVSAMPDDQLDERAAAPEATAPEGDEEKDTAQTAAQGRALAGHGQGRPGRTLGGRQGHHPPAARQAPELPGNRRKGLSG